MPRPWKVLPAWPCGKDRVAWLPTRPGRGFSLEWREKLLQSGARRWEAALLGPLQTFHLVPGRGSVLQQPGEGWSGKDGGWVGGAGAAAPTLPPSL